jgi:cytochrome c-type biogenesis protein CcmH
LRFSWRLLVVLMAFLAVQHGSVRAAGPDPGNARELRIQRSLACPQCTDLPLDVCNQDICNDMKAVIHQKVQAGESDAAVREYFVNRFGTRVLLEPPKNVFHLIAWVLPPAVLLVGSLFTLMYLRGARGQSLLQNRRDRGKPSPVNRARIEQDLENFQ